MVLPQVAHGLPQVLLAGGAEDLRRHPLGVAAALDEVQAAAPDAVLAAPDGEPHGEAAPS